VRKCSTQRHKHSTCGREGDVEVQTDQHGAEVVEEDPNGIMLVLDWPPELPTVLADLPSTQWNEGKQAEIMASIDRYNTKGVDVDSSGKLLAGIWSAGATKWWEEWDAAMSKVGSALDWHLKKPYHPLDTEGGNHDPSTPITFKLPPAQAFPDMEVAITEGLEPVLAGETITFKNPRVVLEGGASTSQSGVEEIAAGWCHSMAHAAH